MKEQTDTHRRCSKCREWKWKHEFPTNRRWLSWECKDCKRTRMSLWRYSKGQEYIDRFYQQTQEGTRRRRQQRMEERHDAAQMYVSLLRDRGWTITRIAAESGLTRNTVAWVAGKKKRWVRESTTTRLRTVFMQEVARS